MTEETKPANGETTNEPTAPEASMNEPAAGGGGDNAVQQSTASATGASTAATPATDAAAATESAAAPTPAPEESAAAPEAAAPEAAAPPPTPAPAPPQSSAAAASVDDDDDEDGKRGSGGGDFDFGAILDQYEQEQAAFQEGSVVRGTVVGITERGVVIDFGFKSEGVVPQEEFTENGELTVKRGDEVEVLVKSMESQEGVPILSRADAVRMRAWDELEKAYRDGTPIKGRITERVKGGLRVDVDGVAAFLPGSQVDVRPIRNLESLRNQEIEAKVIKLNRKRSNVVLSRKAILEQDNESKKGETLDNLEEGI
ncbi:MAG TPA: S1 RNA-binding domain-containing protein, partial [Pyrinomonadaceae bacterium]